MHSAVPMGGPCGSGEQSLDSNPSSIPYKLCELEASDFASLGFTSFPYKMETKILTMGLLELAVTYMKCPAQCRHTVTFIGDSGQRNAPLPQTSMGVCEKGQRHVCVCVPHPTWGT